MVILKGILYKSVSLMISNLELLTCALYSVTECIIYSIIVSHLNLKIKNFNINLRSVKMEKKLFNRNKKLLIKHNL